MKTLICTLIFFSAQCFAWGPTGHRTVGAVAAKYLTPKAKSAVSAILGNETLSRVSTWPDEIKSDPQNYSYTFNWHYTDWKDEDNNHEETNSSGRLLTAIREQVAILKDPKSTKDKKVFALKFIVHLVGDLHMPLHVGNGLDLGGNKCRVVFQGKNTNLHALWDEGMIAFTNLSYTELTDYVSRGRTKQEIRSWMSGDVVEWARESKILRGQIYPDNVVQSSDPMSVKQYCRTDVIVTAEEMPKLSFDYSYKFVPVVEKRLFQAGLRLALIINDIF